MWRWQLGCKELKNEWVGGSEGFQGIRQRVGRERYSQGQERGWGNPFFFLSYSDLSPIMSLSCFKALNYPFYFIRPKVIWPIRSCLIRFLPASPACIFVLSAPAAVLFPPQVFCTSCFLWLEKPPLPLSLANSCTLQISMFKKKKKKVPQRPLLRTAFNLYSKLRHLSWYLA